MCIYFICITYIYIQLLYPYIYEYKTQQQHKFLEFMRRLSVTPNKKIQKQLNDNKLAYLINSLFTNNPSTLAPQPPNKFLTTTTSKSARISARQQTQINLQQNNPSLVISKKLSTRPPPPQNYPFSYNNSHSNSNSRPKTSIPNGCSEYITQRCEEEIQKKRGLAISKMSTDYKGKNSKNNQLYKQSVEELRVEYTLAEPQNLLQRSGNKPIKSICSTKSIGIVKGYSVNSHKFFIHPTHNSQARICIITNLTKTTSQQRIISLYSIFQSKNSSVAYLDFLRQNFCSQITPYLSNVPIPPITSQLISKCLKATQTKYTNYHKSLTRNRPATSLSPTRIQKMKHNFNKDISFAMVFVRNYELTVCLKGDSYVIVSSNFGEKINRFSFGLFKEEMGVTDVRVRVFGREETLNFDYVGLTSNGVYNCNLMMANNDSSSHHKSSGWLHRQIWLSLISQISQLTQQFLQNSNPNQLSLKPNIHTLLGSTLDHLMNLYITSLTSKNISVVCLGFNNLCKLLDNWEIEVASELKRENNYLAEETKPGILSNLELPFKNRKSNIQELDMERKLSENQI